MTAKKIVVTGAAGGIGRTVVQNLLEAGARVIALSRTSPDPSTQQEDLSLETHTVDLRDTASIHRCCREIVQRHSRIDWIVHAAGHIADEASPERDHVRNETFAVNTDAVISLSEQLLSHINPGGGVIILSSTAGIWGNPVYPYYAASKAAASTFGASLAKQWEGTEHRSIVVCPGPTNTPMRQRVAGDANQHQHPEILGKLMVTLTDKASPYKNGDVLVVRNNTISFLSQETRPTRD